jgi:hypothetical protein
MWLQIAAIVFSLYPFFKISNRYIFLVKRAITHVLPTGNLPQT